MTLAQIYAWCDQKTYYSQLEEDIWAAINTAALNLYTEIVTENKGYFIVWDTSSLILIPNTELYALPATLEQIIRLRERLVATDPWRVMEPEDLNDAAVTDVQFLSAPGNSGGAVSDFVYSGPFTKESEAEAGTYIKTIDISPMPADTRMTELVFTAEFKEITGPESPLVIDPPGHNALKYMAVEELLMGEDDDIWQAFGEKGSSHKTQYLKLVRARQQQSIPQVEPYLDDMD